ncbi:hypothetical protein HK099_001078, partial [Clydaea vesicula]
MSSPNDSALGSEIGSIERHNSLNSLNLPNFHSNKSINSNPNNDDMTPNMIPKSSELAPLIPRVRTMNH